MKTEYEDMNLLTSEFFCKARKDHLPIFNLVIQEAAKSIKDKLSKENSNGWL